MEFHCKCPETDCYCTVDTPLSPEDQDQIIMARIFGDDMEHEIIATVICADCSNGWHLTDINTDERTFKEVANATNQSQQGTAPGEAGAEPG